MDQTVSIASDNGYYDTGKREFGGYGFLLPLDLHSAISHDISDINHDLAARDSDDWYPIRVRLMSKCR